MFMKVLGKHDTLVIKMNIVYTKLFEAINLCLTKGIEK